MTTKAAPPLLKPCDTFTGSAPGRYMLSFKREGKNLVAFAYHHLAVVTLDNDKVVMIDFGNYAVQLDGEGLTYVTERIIKHEASVIYEGGELTEEKPPVKVAKITLVDKNKEDEEEG